MKLKINKMSSAVRLALSFSAAMAAGIPVSAPAFAQDAAGQSGQGDQTQATQLKAVVVTGSNIRRVDVETSSPVLSVDHTVIEASGNVTLGDLVQDLPAMTGANTNAQNSSNGTSTVNLRGLGPDRTLILVERVDAPADGGREVLEKALLALDAERFEPARDELHLERARLVDDARAEVVLHETPEGPNLLGLHVEEDLADDRQRLEVAFHRPPPAAAPASPAGTQVCPVM